MPGNSQRRGAVRKSGKGASVGSGGQRRKALEGKGPTPKAAEREYHPAAKKARSATRGTSSAKPGYATGGRPQGRPARGSGRSGGNAKASSEIVAGRNAVVEALRADIPVTTMYVAGRIDADDRVREALKTASERSIPVLETPRASWTGSPTAPSTRASRYRCRPTPTSRSATWWTRRRPASRSSWPSTGSPTRATSAPSSGRSPRSVVTACCCRSAGPRG